MHSQIHNDGDCSDSTETFLAPGNKLSLNFLLMSNVDNISTSPGFILTEAHELVV